MSEHFFGLFPYKFSSYWSIMCGETDECRPVCVMFSALNFRLADLYITIKKLTIF